MPSVRQFVCFLPLVHLLAFSVAHGCLKRSDATVRCKHTYVCNLPGRPLCNRRLATKKLKYELQCLQCFIVLFACCAQLCSHIMSSRFTWKKVLWRRALTSSCAHVVVMACCSGSEDPLNTRRAWEEVKVEKKRSLVFCLCMTLGSWISVPPGLRSW